MAMSRDYIQEIIEKKERLLKRTEIRDQYRRRLYPLIQAFRTLEKSKISGPIKSELLRYIPIGLVACIEGYCRLAIKELIDSGEPYLGRAKEIEELKFKPETIVAIIERKITLGDYIAHFVSLNNLEGINRVFSILTGEDWLARIKTIDTLTLETSKVYKLERPLVMDTEIDNFKELFRMRHILSHELAPREKVGVRRIQHCVSAAGAFMLALNEYIRVLLPPKV
jgi:hypothetical protein